MKQVILDPRTGAVEVAEVPAPERAAGSVLVATAFSVISPGTERATASVSSTRPWRLLRERPDLARRALDVVRRDGLLAAWRLGRARLGTPRALGYSSAGVVLEGSGTLTPGTRVACAGPTIAPHAQVASVPESAAVPVPAGVSLEHAAFAGIGSIAVHAVERARPLDGERFAVLGCGLLGLLCVQLLRAAGVRVAAFDFHATRVRRAREAGAEIAVAGDATEHVSAALSWSGAGVDGVIVAAASPDDAPNVAAARACRAGARVVVVGLVPFSLPRDLAHGKELDLLMSRGRGPDAASERRSIAGFLDALAKGQADVEPLITHRMPLRDAPRAYALVRAADPEAVGIVLDHASDAAASSAAIHSGEPTKGGLGVGVIGAGAFARSTLLPLLAESAAARGVRLVRVASGKGHSAEDAARKFGAEAAGSVDEVLADPAIDLVVIATRHDLHPALTVRALEAGKKVFVEKPLAVDAAGLGAVERALDSARGWLAVGFNRRFAPASLVAREALGWRGAVAVTCRIATEPLPPGHWAADPHAGGGRLIGEGCHFVDLCSFLVGDAPVLSATALPVGTSPDDEDFALTLRFGEGSIGQVLFTSRGTRGLAKERIEAHAGGASVLIDDFRSAVVHAGGRRRKVRASGKGHREEIAALLAAARSGGAPPVPHEVILRVSRATLAAAESLRRAQGE